MWRCMLSLLRTRKAINYSLWFRLNHGIRKKQAKPGIVFYEIIHLARVCIISHHIIRSIMKSKVWRRTQIKVNPYLNIQKMASSNLHSLWSSCVLYRYYNMRWYKLFWFFGLVLPYNISRYDYIATAEAKKPT